jgi:hypothetical protein
MPMAFSASGLVIACQNVLSPPSNALAPTAASGIRTMMLR